LIRRLVQVSVVAGGLSLATLACGTFCQASRLLVERHWLALQAETEAVAQFALLEESIYVPQDATLLAETYSSKQRPNYATAGVHRIYTLPRSCEEVIADYEKSMTDLGWTAVYTQTGGCDTESWLRMRAADGSQFDIYEEPGDQFRLSGEWRTLQERYDGLYYVVAFTYVWYEKPSTE
jgi:hypothetical protein